MEEKPMREIKVCPISGMTQEKILEICMMDSQMEEKKEFNAISTYAKKNYPDICEGNCEKCRKWEKITEKELYIRENDTNMKHFLYNVDCFVSCYLSSLPITMICSYISAGHVLYAFSLSAAAALMFVTANTWSGSSYSESFKKWLGEKWEKENWEVTDMEQTNKDNKPTEAEFMAKYFEEMFEDAKQKVRNTSCDEKMLNVICELFHVGYKYGVISLDRLDDMTDELVYVFDHRNENK